MLIKNLGVPGEGAPILSPLSGSPLDTLAQLGTNTSQAFSDKNLSAQKDSLLKRARAKVMTRAFAAKLANRPSELKRSYLSSLMCAAMLHEHNNKIVGKYCNQRWCLVCNRIRTAKLMNGYLPELEKMPVKYHVVLTAPSVKKELLDAEVQKYYKAISNISQVVRKRRKVKYRGLRKFECTYNLDIFTYHPHYHMILDSLEVAELFVEEWLKRFPDAVRDAQHIGEADNNTCKELFKYFTKIVTKSGKGEEKRITGIHTPSLDTIFLAVRNLRTFQPMGIKKVVEDIEEIQAVEDETRRPQNAIYEWLNNDWCDTTTGEMLTNYIPSDAVKAIIDNIA